MLDLSVCGWRNGVRKVVCVRDRERQVTLLASSPRRGAGGCLGNEL